MVNGEWCLHRKVTWKGLNKKKLNHTVSVAKETVL